jgi:hypothetical protein
MTNRSRSPSSFRANPSSVPKPNGQVRIEEQRVHRGADDRSVAVMFSKRIGHIGFELGVCGLQESGPSPPTALLPRSAGKASEMSSSDTKAAKFIKYLPNSGGDRRADA